MCTVRLTCVKFLPKALSKAPERGRYRRPVFVVQFCCLFSVDLALAQRCKEGMYLDNLKAISVLMHRQWACVEIAATELVSDTFSDA